MRTQLPNLSSPLFLVQITDKTGTGPTAEYEFTEVWHLEPGTSEGAVEKVGGRYADALNKGYEVTGRQLEVDDYALARSADGTGGITWELVALCCPSGPPPDPPTDLVTTPVFNGIAVSWTAPTPGPTPVDNYTLQYTVGPGWGVNTLFTVPGIPAGGSPNHTFMLTGIPPGTAPNILVAVFANSPAGTGSNYLLGQEPRPVLMQTIIDNTGTQLTTVWSDPNVLFNTGVLTLSGDQSGTATYASGSGTNTLIFDIDTVINEDANILLAVPAALVEDSDSDPNVEMENIIVVNNSTVPPAIEFTSGSGNWNATVTGTVTWEIWGAGGPGGGGGSAFGGGGGGSGEYRTGTLAVTSGNNYAYSIGASPGGNTTFNGNTANGGSSGQGGFPAGGLGGAGGSGGSGGTGTNGNTGNSATALGGPGADGAAAPGPGGGAGGTGGALNSAGTAGTGPGGGGGGGGRTTGGTSAGGAGRLRITLP